MVPLSEGRPVSDERLRELGRAASTGDTDAKKALRNERRRNSLCVHCGTQWYIMDPPKRPGFMKRALWKAMGVPYEEPVYEPKCIHCNQRIENEAMARVAYAAFEIMKGSVPKRYNDYDDMDNYVDVEQAIQEFLETPSSE